MPKLQVLITTMHKTDFAKINEMNIQTDAVIANQADSYSYDVVEDNGIKFEMITTATRGASKNRNIALEYSSPNAEYIMFSDDDLVYVDGYEKLIIEEFENHPKAQAIKFNLYNLSEKRKIFMKNIEKFKKGTRRNLSSSGIWALVIKREVLDRYNFRFKENFGPGTENYCGEDTIFIQKMLNEGVKVYLSPVTVAGIDQSESTWFEGYNEKYFYVGGKVFADIYPKSSWLIAIRSALRFSKRESCRMNFFEILKCYWKGVYEYLSFGGK